VVEGVLGKMNNSESDSIASILQMDSWARAEARQAIKELTI